MSAPPTLRPYQSDIIERVAAARSGGHKRILLVMPTGAGKTVVFARIIANLEADGGNTLILAHRRELIKQTSAKLYDAGVDHGIIQAGFPTRPDAPVQVASIQTLHARAISSKQMNLPEADIIVIDEAHHCRAATYQKIVDSYPEATILGLTATPVRGDGKGLGASFDILLEGTTIPELVTEGYLVPTKVYAPTTPDLEGIGIRMGDYAEDKLAERMDDAKLVGDIVTHWHRLAEGRPTVVFATGVSHSVHIRDEFARSGVVAEHIDGKTPAEERDDILSRLAKGQIDVVTNCAVLTEGWDCPNVSCLVLARPTKSPGLFRQMMGRVLRPNPGKTDALIIDHAGATAEHGFVDEPIEWFLQDDRRAMSKRQSDKIAGRAPKLTTCPECTAARWSGRPCSACGWGPNSRALAVEILEGDLALMDRTTRAAVAQKASEAEKLLFYRMLSGFGQEQGYKPGWAAFKWKEKHGAWPPRSFQGYPPLRPDEPVRSWIRSRQIAWAKSQAKPRQGAAA